MTLRRFLSLLLLASILGGWTSGAPQARPIAEVTVLVLFDESAPPAARQALHEAAAATVTGRIEEIGLERVSLPASNLALYENSGLVEAVEEPRTLEVMGRRPNDPLLPLQWSLRRVGALGAWKIENGKKAEVLVAVIDTGVDPSHADLKGRVLDGIDFLDLDEDPYDDHGHGTHIAGVIAANVSNREGIAGISHGASIVPMKTCTSGGSCPIFETYAGIVEAVRRGASILNLSLGGAGPCTFIDQTVFDWVHDQGSLAIAAAGNSGAEDNPTITPANCEKTLGVGALDRGDRRAEFSGYGDWVDISAPGVEIWSTFPPILTVMTGHIGYAPLSGTSMATPVVAGAAALVKASHPDWTPEQITKRLTDTAEDIGKKGRDDHFGHGVLDLRRAVR